MGFGVFHLHQTQFPRVNAPNESTRRAWREKFKGGSASPEDDDKTNRRKREYQDGEAAVQRVDDNAFHLQ
jgi:hypothetical protein